MTSRARTFYLGLGTLSSGTAVQTESGVFCSLNLPLKTFSMSSMLKAHTAEPGMLQEKQLQELRTQWHRPRGPRERTGALPLLQGCSLLTC